MEVLAGVSSAFAVVSLSLELGNKAKKLYDFWNSIQDAPKDIRNISRDLRVVSSVLEEIGQDADSERPHSRALVANLAALEQCDENLEAFQKLLERFEPGFASEKKTVRKWASFKAAFQGKEIRKFQETLRDVKSTLLLARQASSSRAITSCLESHRQEIAIITQGVSVLLQEQTTRNVTTNSVSVVDPDVHFNALRLECQRAASTISNPVARLGFQKAFEAALSQIEGIPEHKRQQESQKNTYEEVGIENARSFSKKRQISRYSSYYSHQSLFGILYVRTNTALSPEITDEEEPDDTESYYQTTSNIAFHPSEWLLTCGLRYGIEIAFNNSFHGVDCRMSTYRAVPDDSPVFELCRIGDVDNLQKLFYERKGSPWDTNSKGWTPLHFAAQEKRPDVCQFLLAQNANSKACTWYGGTVQGCALSNSKSTSCRRCIDTLRLFIEDEYDDFPEIFRLTNLVLTSCNANECFHPAGAGEVFLWALPKLSQSTQLFNDGPASNSMTIRFLRIVAIFTTDVRLLAQILPFVKDINANSINPRSSAGHTFVKIITENYLHWKERGQMLIQHGLDLHMSLYCSQKNCTCIDNYGCNTLLSCIMETSAGFYRFTQLLRDMAFDIPTFIRDELKQATLVKAGWTQDTLHSLFDLRFSPLGEEAYCCSTHTRIRKKNPAEKSWITMLDSIKRMPESGLSIAKILSVREQELLESNELVTGECWECRDLSKISSLEGKVEDSEDDSPFLLAF